MTKDRFAELCKVETLKIAVNYVFDDQKDDFLPDVIRHQDYLFNLEENLSRLAHKLTNGTYRPRPLREIDVPKTGLSVRPGSSLDIEDHIVFFGIAYLLAPILDKALPKSVFHFRVRKKGNRPHPNQLFQNEHLLLLTRAKRKKLRIFDNWYEVWPNFMEEAQALYEKEGFTYLIESDIAAFFENINHPLLADVLRQHAPKQLPLINLLMEMISAWTTPSLWGIRPHRGIPQGNEVSSWLGTLFLVQMDFELLKLQRQGKIKYVRYVDDLKVFAKNTKTARRVVMLINQLLRRMHLNMQTSKTQIYHGEEIRKKLQDERVEKVTTILETLPENKAIISGIQKQRALAEAKILFNEYFAHRSQLRKEDVRLFKRVLTLLTRIESPMAINLCLRCIWDQPALTAKAAKYLAHWIGRKTVRDAINRALFGDEELFDTQYLDLLPLLRRSKALIPDHKTKFLALAQNLDLHWAVRAEAFIGLILFPLTESDYTKLEKIYNCEGSACVKKVILGLFLSAPYPIKQSFLSKTIYEPEEEINRFRKFLWALKNSTEHCKPVLKAVASRERDPARLLITLHGANHSSDLHCIQQVKQIAKKYLRGAKSE
ncbi:MAG TPA: RNA-directed DNA polymerase, partial [Puia sp.]|nr:RNA-directed DNA polymerase [Puia sp.]